MIANNPHELFRDAIRKTSDPSLLSRLSIEAFECDIETQVSDWDAFEAVVGFSTPVSAQDDKNASDK